MISRYHRSIGGYDHRVVATYKGLDRDLDVMLQLEVGRTIDGAGFDFVGKERDLEWMCKDVDQANRIADRLRKFEPRIKIEVF